MDRISQILGIYKSKQDVNTDTYLKVQFNGNERILPPDELNRVLDLGQQFNTERQGSSFYRIVSKINPIISNVLFNTTSLNDSWFMLSTDLYTANTLNNDLPNMTFSDSINQNLKEIDGWYGRFDPDKSKATLCNFFDMEPKRERFSFTPDLTNISGTTKNWELTITYPYSTDTTHNMVSGGLLIIDKTNVNVGGKNMVAFSVPVLHNLSEGDNIILTGTSNDGTYTVKRIGLDNGDLKNNYFCLDIDSGTTISNGSRMIKLYNGVPSQYYFRKFTRVATRSSDAIQTGDYEIYKLAFSENIFTDDITQVIFNDDINVANLVDNLGRPLSELYLTIVKTDSNGIFSNVSSGIEVPFISELNTGNINTYLKNIPVIQKIHNVVSATNQTFNSLESNVNINNNDFYGDVVEYNQTTVQEVILSDVFHRFNTLNREANVPTNSPVAGPRPEGYYYKAHNLIRIRNFSSYIDQGDINTVGMPSYTTDLGDGRFIWRELLDIGVTDISKGVLNYPFINGCHYMYDNYCFYLRRQDPFDNWNMYFSSFPADPIGSAITDNYKVNSSNNVC